MSEPIVYKNEKAKKEMIISSLEQLKTSTGWLVIKKVLEAEVKGSEARLHGEVPLAEGETIKEWQDRRNDRIKLMTLPDDLIEANRDREKFDDNLDPFE